MIDPKRFWMHFGVFSLVLVAWFAFILSHSLYAWAIIPVFSGLAILLGKPPAMLWWGLGWFMWTQYVQRELWVGFFNYLDELVTLGMLAILFVHSRHINSIMPERMQQIRPFPAITFHFILLTFLSAILNHAIDVYFIMWSFQYLRMFIVFYFVVRFFRVVDVRIFLKFVMYFSIMLFLLNLGWKLHINPLPNEKEYWPSDFAVGSFAACDQVAYFCVMVIMLCLGVILDPPSEKFRKLAWMTLFATFLNFLMTNTNHAFFLLAGGLAVFYVFNFRQVSHVVSLPALAGVAILIIGMYGIAMAYTEAGEALRPENLQRRYERFMNGTKMLSYRRNFTELPHESDFFWFVGHGPGQAGSSIGRALRRPIGDKYFNVLKRSEEFRADLIASSIASGEQTGFLSYWSELGPFGLLLLLVIYGWVVLKTKRRLWTNDYADKHQLAMARALPSVVAVIMAISFLRDMFYIAWLVGLFWVWAALVVIPVEKGARKSGMEIL
jgi:hypothetical protein